MSDDDVMEIAFGLPVSGSWARPDIIAAVATQAEDLGYSTLWSFQRLLVGVDRTLPPVYQSVADPLLPLAYAAAVTERIRLGTAIVNLPFFAPPVLAKQFATLDVLSGGRSVAGVGLGWEEEEFVAVGVDFARRGARGEEYLAALRAVWGTDPVEFAGEFYTIPASTILPKPVQPGGPPLLLGGSAEPALRRAGRLADGWISSSRTDLGALGASIGLVRGAATEAGRDPDTLEYVCRGVLRDAPRDGPLTGSLSEVRDDLLTIAAQGVTEVFLDLNFDPSVGNPEADPQASLQRARDVLTALAPS